MTQLKPVRHLSDRPVHAAGQFHYRPRKAVRIFGAVYSAVRSLLRASVPRSLGAALFTILLGFACGAAPTFADLLPVSGSASVNGKTSILSSAPNSVASVTQTLSSPQGSATGLAEADNVGPIVNVQGESHGVAAGGAEAQVSYYTEVNTFGPGRGLCPGNCLVPVTFQFQLQATASALGGNSTAAAEASSFFYVNGPSGAALGGSESMLCTSSGCTSSSSTPATTGFVDVIGSSGLSDPLLISVSAEGTSQGYSQGQTASFLAIADPIVQIADELIPGTSINYRDAYALSFSSGVVQGVGTVPPTVPEPGTLGLLVVGIGFLVVMRKRMGRGLAITNASNLFPAHFGMRGFFVPFVARHPAQKLFSESCCTRPRAKR